MYDGCYTMVQRTKKRIMKIFNTASREIEEFAPINASEVKMYACGPTVYNFAHIGNMRTYVFEDVLRRTLEGFGYNVKHVMNITDVGHLQSDADSGDDKMSVAAQKQQKSPWVIAKEYEEAFFKHSQLLNIKRPHIVARATEHVQEMIEMVSTLMDKGFAYESEGNVYFDVAKFPEYPDFARLQMDSQQSTSRVDFDHKKKNQADFALWFSQSKFPNQIMKWPSPWGEGFPGWHIECSAMATKYLGTHFDLHCGGIDHIPVHHTNEIAQSECCSDHKWVNYWMHGAFLTVDDGKMSKSKGDVLTVDTIKAAGFHPLAYRYLILTSNYRGELKFNYEVLEAAQNAYKGLYEKVQEWTSQASTAHTSAHNPELVQKYSDAFWDAMANDLHTPTAIGVTWSVARDETLSSQDKLSLFKEFDTVLGLHLSDSDFALSPEEQQIIDDRNQARINKNWAESDRLRDTLLEQYGIQIKDTKGGAQWIRTLPACAPN